MIDKDNFTIDIREEEVIDFKEELTAGEIRQIRQGVLEKIQSDSREKSGMVRWFTSKAAVAAAACFILTTTSVFAVSKLSGYFHSKVTQDEYRVNIDIRKDSDENSQEPLGLINAVTSPKTVKLVHDNLNDYTVENEKDGWYAFRCREGFEAGQDFGCELIQVDQDIDQEFFIDNVSKWESVLVNGNSAVYMERYDVAGSQYEDNTRYTKRMFVFYETEGYILQFYAMQGIEKERLLQYASEVTIVECREEERGSYVRLSQYITFNKPENGSTGDLSVKAGQVISQNETAVFRGVEYQVQRITVLDSISGLLKEDGKGFNNAMNLWENRLEFSDADGSLKTYIREKLSAGDGHTDPYEKVEACEKVAQRLVMVDLRVKNTTDETKEDVMICLGLAYLMEHGNGFALDTTQYNRPKAIGSCQLDPYAQYFRENDGGKGFYLKDLEPGQEEVYHIGYFVDEDKLNQMFLSVDGGAISDGQYEGVQIDLRQ